MRYQFENFLLDTDRRELHRRGRLRSLEPQVFDLLEYLIANHDRVVARDEIFDAVWHGRIVSEGALSTRVNAARRAVDDDGKAQRLIRTIRTRGFRFIGVLAKEDERTDTTVSKIINDRQSPIRLGGPSVAMLPCFNIDGDGAGNAFADALTEEMITSLGKSDWLSVASRHSSFAYKNRSTDARQIARKLGVRYLLEGSIRQSKGQTRFTVRLIDGETDSQIWSELLEAKATVLLERGIDSIAAAVVQHIYMLERMRAEHEAAKNPGSWEFTIRTLSLMNSRVRSQVEAARSTLEAAINCDTGSARHYSLFSFAVTLGLQQGWERQQDAIPLALQIAETALALNPEEPWAHLALGYALVWQQPEEALRPVERALMLNPKLAIGHYLFALALTRAGLPQGISERAELGRKLSAFDLLAYGNTGVYNNVRASACLVAGQYNDGIGFAEKAIVESRLLAPAYRQLVANCALAGRTSEARSALAKLKRLSPDISLEWIEHELKWSRAKDQRSYVEAFRSAGLT